MTTQKGKQNEKRSKKRKLNDGKSSAMDIDVWIPPWDRIPPSENFVNVHVFGSLFSNSVDVDVKRNIVGNVSFDEAKDYPVPVSVNFDGSGRVSVKVSFGEDETGRGFLDEYAPVKAATAVRTFSDAEKPKFEAESFETSVNIHDWYVEDPRPEEEIPETDAEDDGLSESESGSDSGGKDGGDAENAGDGEDETMVS